MTDEPLTVPEWVCTLVGRLVLDNEALRRALPISEEAVTTERARIAEMLVTQAELTSETEQTMAGRSVSAAGVLQHAAQLVMAGTSAEDLLPRPTAEESA